MSHHNHHQNTSQKKVTAIVIGLSAFILLVVIGLVLSYRPPTTPNQAQATGPTVLAAEVMAQDFGTVSMANGPVSKVFTIKNPTDNTATIQKLYTSCMCTSATLIQNSQRIGPFGMPGHGGPIPTIAQTLNAGESAEVEVTFDPAAHGPAGVGPIQRDVYIETVGGGRLVLQIKAQVTP